MIYLDNYGHLFSDESFQELYDFGVKKLKLKPTWNHYSKHFPHFDLTTKRKKELALKNGAVLIENNRDLVELFRKVRDRFKIFYDKYKEEEYYYEAKGLVGQKILRVNFKTVLYLEKLTS